jgi:hypothetical protein
MRDKTKTHMHSLAGKSAPQNEKKKAANRSAPAQAHARFLSLSLRSVTAAVYLTVIFLLVQQQEARGTNDGEEKGNGALPPFVQNSKSEYKGWPDGRAVKLDPLAEGVSDTDDDTSRGHSERRKAGSKSRLEAGSRLEEHRGVYDV